MKKRTLYKAFAALVAVFVLANATIVYGLENGNHANSVSWESKIKPCLREKMQEIDGDIPVWLWMEDIDSEEVEQKVYEKTGLREENLSVIEEPISAQLAIEMSNLSDADKETKAQVKAEFQGYLDRTKAAREIEAQRVDTYIQEMRTVQKDMHSQKNASTFEKLGLSEDKILVSETGAPVYIVYLSKEDIERVAKSPKVTAIYYYDIDAVMVPEVNNLDKEMEASSVSRIQTDIQLTGKGVKIGIYDEGRVAACEEIADSRITYLSPSKSTVADHSTNVARIAAGSKGVAPEAQIYSTSAYAETFLEELQLENLITALASLSDAGVAVINHSMHIFEDAEDYDAPEIYIDYMIRTKRFAFVTSAGNEHGVISSPGLAYNAITVGGYHNNGTKEVSDDVMYEYSSYRNLACCAKPDFIASQPYIDARTGTSYAAPFVTGTIALLYQVRPALKSQPEAVKAILMASCHRKVTPSEGDPVELMSSGLTEHQGAGAIDPYIAVAIAGSGNYGVRFMDSTSTVETIRFQQPAYGSTGLNVSLAWAKENPSETEAGEAINLTLRLLRGGSIIKASTNTNSSTEMVYVTPSSSDTNYTIRIDRNSATGTTIRYAYAFSVDHTRYQYMDISEGVYFIKNKETGLYLTLSNGYTYQKAFTGATEQKWVLNGDTVAAATTATNRLSIGSTIAGSYKRAITDTSDGEWIIFQRNTTNSERDGSVTFYSYDSDSALSIYNNSSTNGASVARYPYTSSNEYQKWYLEPVAYQRGDVDVDGEITTTDSRMISQYVLGSVTFSDMQKYLGDVNGDGTIDTTDSQLALQIASGTVA